MSGCVGWKTRKYVMQILQGIVRKEEKKEKRDIRRKSHTRKGKKSWSRGKIVQRDWYRVLEEENGHDEEYREESKRE